MDIIIIIEERPNSQKNHFHYVNLYFHCHFHSQYQNNMLIELDVFL